MTGFDAVSKLCSSLSCCCKTCIKKENCCIGQYHNILKNNDEELSPQDFVKRLGLIGSFYIKDKDDFEYGKSKDADDMVTGIKTRPQETSFNDSGYDDNSAIKQ